MRGVLAIVGLIVLGAAAFWMLQQDDPVVLPSDNGAPAHDPDDQERATTPIAREAAPLPERPDPVDEPADEAAPPPPAEPDPEPPAPVLLVLDVFEAGSRAPVAAFRWRFSQNGINIHGEIPSHHAELPMAGLKVGKLLVEADGLQPFEQDLTLPPPGLEPTRLDVYLTRITAAEGISLWVRHLDGEPATHVRVDAFELDAGNRDRAWQLGAPVWARRTGAGNGNYVLPPLPVGEYGIQLVATDELGQLLPRMPFRRVYQLTGSNGYVEDVTLLPACALTLELVDANDQPLDPQRLGTVVLSLQKPGETGVRRKWAAQGADGGTVTAADILPAKAPTWLTEPIAGGSYELQVLVDGSLRASRMLLLQTGRRQTERVLVP